MIHVSSEASNLYDKASPQFLAVFIFQKITAFVVPAFIFISGFKIANKYKKEPVNYLKFILNRIKKIYLPYIFVASVYFYYFVFREFEILDFERWFRGVFFGTISAPFYFIVIIMQFYLLVPIWLWIIKKYPFKIIGISALIINLFFKFALPEMFNNFSNSTLQHLNFLIEYNDRIFLSYIIYWIIGCYLGKNYLAAKKFLTGNKVLIIISYLIIASTHLTLSFLSVTGKYQYYAAEFVHVIFCIISVLFFYLTTIKLTNISGKFMRKTFMWQDAISFNVYLWHCIFIAIIDEQFYLNQVMSITERLLMRALYTFTVVIILSSLWQAGKNFFIELKKKTKKGVV